MRSVKLPQNCIRYPLNHLLGSEGSVRVLRVYVTGSGIPLTAADAARLAGLTPPGVRKVIPRLVETGLLERVGKGTRALYRMRRKEPLSRALAALFQAEANRFAELIERLKTLVAETTPPPVSAWIQRLPYDPQEALEFCVFHRAGDIDEYLREMRAALSSLEQRFDQTIEIRGYTRADRPPDAGPESILLFGVPPGRTGSSAAIRTHADADRQLLLLSRAVAAALKRDSSLVGRALEHTRRVLRTPQGMASADIREWSDILSTYSIPRLSRFLISSSDRALRLRQSCPLFAVLTEDEKKSLAKQAGLHG